MPTNRLKKPKKKKKTKQQVLPAKRFAIARREEKGDSAYEVITQSQSHVQSQKPVKDIQKFLDSYNEFVWVYASIYTIANSAAGIPLTLFKKDEEGNLEEQIDHPLLSVINKPNEIHTKHDFIELTFTHLESTGNAFWELVRDQFGTIKKMYPLNPKRIEIKGDEDKFIKEYIFEVNGNKISIPPENILHLKYPNPDNDYWGLSPLSAASNALLQEENTIEWNKSFFKNSARPDIVFNVEGPISAKGLKRLRAMIKKMYGGVEKAHSAAIVEGGLKVDKLGFAPKDLEFLELRKFDRDEILAVFGVPPALVGVYESAIKANASEQRKFFWETTMIHKLMKVEMALNHMYVPNFEKFMPEADLELKFDLSAVDALGEASDEKSVRVTREVGAGIMTRNEARLELGLETLPGLDKIYIPSAIQPILESDAEVDEDGNPIMPEPAPPKPTVEEVDTQPKIGLSKERADIIWKQAETIRDPLLRDGEREVKDFFELLEEEVLERLSVLAKYKKKKYYSKNISVDSIFPERATQESLEATLDTLVGRTLKHSSNLAILEIAIDVGIGPIPGINEHNPAIADFIKNRAFQASSSIVNTTKERLRRVLTQAFDGNMSLPDIRALIKRELTGEVAAGRIGTIVQTEVGTAYSKGRRFAVEQIESFAPEAKLLKVWISARDGKVRASHVLNDSLTQSQPLPLEAVYANGLKFPNDPAGSAGEVINCRCVESYVSGSINRRSVSGLLPQRKVRLTDGTKIVTRKLRKEHWERQYDGIIQKMRKELIVRRNGKH